MSLNAKEVRAALDGIAGTTVATLNRVGLLQGCKSGREILYPESQVKTLANAEPIDTHSPAYLLRVSRWSESWTDSEKMEVASGPHGRVGAPNELIGMPLVISVAEWVVAAFLITGHESDEFKTKFKLLDDKSISSKWVGRKIPWRRGPVRVRLPLV